MKVSIKFECGGPMTVRDERGGLLLTNRIAVYLLPGSECPVAEVESGGVRYEAHVTALDVIGGPAAEKKVEDDDEG